MIRSALEYRISIKEFLFVQDFVKNIDTKYKNKGKYWKAFVSSVIDGGLKVLFIERFETVDTHELVFDVYVGFVNGDLDLSCAGRTCVKDIKTLQRRYELNPDFIFNINWELSKEDTIQSFLNDLKRIEFNG